MRVRHRHIAQFCLLVVATADVHADLLFDNGTHVETGYSSQLDTSYPFDSQVADDFRLASSAVIEQVHWVGWAWCGSPPPSQPEFNVIFYSDADGQPTGGPGDPTVTALAVFTVDASSVENDDGSYSHEASIPGFTAEANTTYWLSVQAVFPVSPQWGWAPTDDIDGTAVQGFPLLGIEYWTPIDRETSFQLYGGPARCAADLDGDGEIGVSDLLTVLGAWSTAAGDVTGDGMTDVADLLAVLAAWGACT